MAFKSCLLGLAFAIITSLVRAYQQLDHRLDHPATNPLIIAHRGSSGMLPAHTIEAYQLAIDQGADFIECDVCLTKDLQLMCMHNHWMEGQSNVAEVFSGTKRKSTHFVEDKHTLYTDYFSVEFTLAELKRLRVRQDGKRDPSHNDEYTIPTLEEFIQVARSSPRPVGIYVEVKTPIWLNSLPLLQDRNLTVEQLIVTLLSKYNYIKKTDPCILQSFSTKSLEVLRDLTELPLVYLVPETHTVGLLNNNTLEEWARAKGYYGLGILKSIVVEPSPDTNRIKAAHADLVHRIHAYGLKLHLFTFRNDGNMAFDFGFDPYAEYEFFVNLGIDGLFTDFPATLRRYLQYAEQREACTPRETSALYTYLNASNALSVIYCLVLGYLVARAMQYRNTASSRQS